MSKIEKEIKILDIDVEDAKNRLLKFGAKYIQESLQKIYTYDIPSIYYRFLEIKHMLQCENTLIQQVNFEKFINLAYEVFDLFTPEQEKLFLLYLNVSKIEEIKRLSITALNELIQSEELNKLLTNFDINENKWIRLRQTNKKTTLTVKHIVNKQCDDMQYVKESEIVVNDLNEANDILEKIGIVSRNYQEKRRTSFIYENAEIEIDEWPMLKPYMEIECDNEALMNKIIKGLKYEDKEIISTNTASLYAEIGIDVLKMKELRFKSE